MKKGLFVTLSVLFTVLLYGCASTPAASSAENVTVPVEESEKSAGQKTESSGNSGAKKQLYEDWKYKGFGKSIPEWVTPALNGDSEKVKKVLGLDVDVQLEILTGYGINVDQSENKLKSQVKGGLQFVDGFWVLLNSNQHKEEPYVTILIYRN